jgi:hypothetical protein
MKPKINVIAVVALAVALYVAGASAQTITFNTPYTCPAGISYVVEKCEMNGRAEICSWEQFRNGKSLGRANAPRVLLDRRLRSCTTTPAGQPAAAPAAPSRQTPAPAPARQAGPANRVSNPAYISQFPSVERVNAELKGPDPLDTAARRMGGFWQLQQIIRDLSGPRVYRNQLTVDENRLIGAYAGGYQSAEQPYASLAGPERMKWFQMHSFYEVDDRFREELFKQFLSPALLAEYTKAKADQNATRQANRQAEEQAMKARQQAAKMERDQAEAQLQALTKQQQQPEWQRRLTRCVAAGRSETQCFTEEVGKGFGEILPLFNNAPPPPGLALAGAYSQPGGFGIWFYPEHAVVTCTDVRAEAGYAVEMKENQVQVRLVASKTVGFVKLNEDLMKALPQSSKPDEWQNQRIVFSFRPDGKMTGSGPINVTGMEQTGTEQKGTRTVYNEFGLAIRTEPITEPVYKARTARCTLGTLSPAGPSPAVGSMSTLTATALNLASGGADKAAGKMPPPGFRINGRYFGQTSFDVEFFPESVLLTCRQAVVARDYTASVSGNRIVVNIQNGATPLALDFRPDGTLSGSGPVQVSGRVMLGQKERVENGLVIRDPVFQPITDTCTLGALTPSQPGTR